MTDAAVAIEASQEEIPTPPPSSPQPKKIRGALVRVRMADGSTIEIDSELVEVLPHKRPRGFAAMTPEQRAVVSAKGGAATQANGKAHRFTSESGRAAGLIGGRAPHVRRGRQPKNATTTTQDASVLSNETIMQDRP